MDDEVIVIDDDDTSTDNELTMAGENMKEINNKSDEYVVLNEDILTTEKHQADITKYDINTPTTLLVREATVPSFVPTDYDLYSQDLLSSQFMANEHLDFLAPQQNVTKIEDSAIATKDMTFTILD
ncbi:hypothetical protein O0L34_g13206 [Tuta absoluta]|nr:hypothetical protein O0L34_g13206 [Tuta absoluta]